MQHPNKKEFLRDTTNEVNGNREMKHWKIINKGQLPEGEPILDSVRSME